MIYIAAIFAALFFATIFGKPAVDPARPATVPTWRCTLRGKQKQVIDVPATSEADAMKALMKMNVDITKIQTLELIS